MNDDQGSSGPGRQNPNQGDRPGRRNRPGNRARRQAQLQADEQPQPRHEPQPDSASAPAEPRGAAREAAAVRPVASPARIRKRHRFIVVSLFAILIIPLAAVMIYLFFIAKDQYASNTGFTVRSNETSSASELVGGLSSLVGGGGAASNGNVLYAFIQSQEIVERIQADLDILGHFSQTWNSDPVFSIWPDATIEDLLWFWQRIVTVSYDQSSGLMDVQVRAHTPEFAQAVAERIVAESERMINQLNEQSRRDAMANAERDLEDALARLRTAREDLAAFRARTQIVDPQADIQGRMGVINNLQQQLAQALVDHDLLLQTATENDPRLRQAERQIEVIQERIAIERRNFATQDVTVFDTDYPRLIAQFESLMVNQRFAEETYTAALAALDVARSNAERQNLYLATFVRPTLAQRAEYPKRFLLSGLTFLFLGLAWAAFTLVYYSLRDRG